MSENHPGRLFGAILDAASLMYGKAMETHYLQLRRTHGVHSNPALLLEYHERSNKNSWSRVSSLEDTMRSNTQVGFHFPFHDYN